MSLHGFNWYQVKASGECNTYGLASDYQELLTRMEVELQNLQDALINGHYSPCMQAVANNEYLGTLIALKLEQGEKIQDHGFLSTAAPIIECPYCLREMQTLEDANHGWVLPEHSLMMHTDNAGERQILTPEDPDCPNSGKGPAEFLIRE